MKKSLLLIFTFVTFYAGYSQCPPGDVVLQTQAEVNQFFVDYPSCTKISGNLDIGNLLYTATDITSISPLSAIQEITGYLDIHGNTSLTSLSPLSTVTTFGGYISVYWNGVTSLTGLEGANALAGVLYVGWNSSLPSLAGLDEITSVGGYVWIENNSNLASFNGLDKLTSITGNVFIDNNDILANVNSLGELTAIGGYLWFQGNDILSGFTGFNKLASIGGSFHIESNGTISSLNGFDVLVSVGENVFIQANASLTSLNGIETLTDIGTATGNKNGIQIDDNDALTDISGIVNIDANDLNQLNIRYNANLATCHIDNICTYFSLIAGPPFNQGDVWIVDNKPGEDCVDTTAVNAACATASVSDYLLDNAVSIYPNPTSDQLNIDIISDINIEHLALYSMQGRLIKEQSYQLQSMDMSNVASGIYMLKIASDRGDINVRIVKQ